MGTRRCLIDEEKLKALRERADNAIADAAYAQGFADAFAWIQEAKRFSAEKRRAFPLKYRGVNAKYSSVGALAGQVRGKL